MTAHPNVVGFLTKVTVAHVVTYLLVGVIAAAVFDYATVFSQPVVRDFMKPFGSVAVFVGPLVQVARGLLIAAVLLPFRTVLSERRGWLWLWLLLIGVGIVSTSAAAPGSLEGVIYSRLPLWYHVIGIPEMLVQTLLFSILAGPDRPSPQRRRRRSPTFSPAPYPGDGFRMPRIRRLRDRIGTVRGHVRCLGEC